MMRRQRPQADRSEQPLLDGFRTTEGQRDESENWMAQRNRKKLVGTASRVIAFFAVDDVIEITDGRVPEALVE